MAETIQSEIDFMNYWPCFTKAKECDWLADCFFLRTCINIFFCNNYYSIALIIVAQSARGASPTPTNHELSTSLVSNEKKR